MVAPVLPAETMADARPSRTASAARTSDESFIVRTLDPGSASMPMTCDAGMSSRSPRSGSTSSGRPDQHDADAELGRGLEGALDDRAGRVVAAHGVDGDGQQAPGLRSWTRMRSAE